MEKGYIYSLRIPGAIMPQYIGQTIAPKRRRTNHKKFDTSKCTSSKLYALWSSIEFAIEEEIIAVDQAALRFLMDAGERGYIAAYREHLVNNRAGGFSVVGDANPFYGKIHTAETRKSMKEAWTAERKTKMSNYVRRNCPWTKFTDNQILTIRNSDETNQKLAKQYAVSQATIIRIRKHETHTHVGGPAYKSRRYKHGKYAKSLNLQKD